MFYFGISFFSHSYARKHNFTPHFAMRRLDQIFSIHKFIYLKSTGANILNQSNSVLFTNKIYSFCWIAKVGETNLPTYHIYIYFYQFSSVLKITRQHPVCSVLVITRQYPVYLDKHTGYSKVLRSIKCSWLDGMKAILIEHFWAW